MKMIVAIVSDEFAGSLTEQLARKGFGATKLASTGGFLRAGNTTFLIGVSEEQMDEVLGVIKAACPSHGHTPLSAEAPDHTVAGVAAAAGQAVPTGSRVGGATVFVLNVSKMLKV